MNRPTILLIISSTFLVTGCGIFKKNDKTGPTKKGPAVTEKRIIGRIASVSQTGDFVLIQKYGFGMLPTESIFQSRGEDDRTASLRPSGERVRDFFAADIIRGIVKKGDAVIAYPDPKIEEEETEESEKKSAAERPADQPIKRSSPDS